MSAPLRHAKPRWTTQASGSAAPAGAAEDRVKSVIFEDIGHLIAMEATERTADHASEWVGGELERWRKDEEEHERTWTKGKTLVEKQRVDEEWKRQMGGPYERPKKMGEAKL